MTTTGTITVTPNNTIALTSATGTDAQTICIGSAITNITYATTGATGATITGLPAGVTGAWLADVITISGTPSAAGPATYSVNLTGGCGTITIAGTITVEANNTIAITSAAGTDAQTSCINTAISSIIYATTGATGATVTGLPAGVTAAWLADVLTISGTPTVPGPSTYTVTLTGGCGTVTTTGTITVTPDNTLSIISPAGTDAQTVCTGTAITNIIYSTTGATGATITGLPAGVSGTWLADVITISGIPTVAGPSTYTITLTGGCGAISATGTINVTPDNTVALTSAPGTDGQAVCTNTALVNITYATTGATGATVSGLPAGVSFIWVADVLTISGIPVTAGPSAYTITLTGGCGTITTGGTILVNLTPSPAFTAEPGAETCANSAVTYTTQPGQTNYVWTLPGVSGTDYTITSGGSAADNTVTLMWLTTGSKTVGINYTVGACNAGSPTLSTATMVTAVSGNITSQINVPVPGGNTGSVTVTGTGGNSPYLYSLNSGAYQASGTFGSLSAGTYTVTVQDINLCTFDVPLTITEPSEVLSGAVDSQTNVACFGTATGSVTIAGSGGVPPYDYNLDAGVFQTSGTFGNLVAGTYTVTVRDAGLITADVNVTITEPAASVGGSITSQTDVLCAGTSTGNVTVAGSGGTSLISTGSEPEHTRHQEHFQHLLPVHIP